VSWRRSPVCAVAADATPQTSQNRVRAVLTPAGALSSNCASRCLVK
jgi:hypothetical protein